MGRLTLDDDVSYLVLHRLPTRDLLAFKCVSKGWQRLISDRSFADSQSKRKEPLSGFFFQQRSQLGLYDLKTISYIPANLEGGVEVELHQNMFEFLPREVVVVSSSNGLVCCRTCLPIENDATIFVCNPLNKQWISVDWPSPRKSQHIAMTSDPFRDLNFTVVIVEQLEDETTERLYFSFKIYCSRSKTWKVSKEICWCGDSLWKNKGIFLGKVLYWLTDGDKILTFDLESELSLLVPLPVPATEFICVPEGCIGESEGQLHYAMVSEEGLHVWAVDDYIDNMWSLKHSKTLESLESENRKFFCNLRERVTTRSIVDPHPWIDPFAFRDGVLVMRVSNHVYLYRTKTGKTSRIWPISKFGTDHTYCPSVVPYSTSLVTLKPQ